MELEYSYARTLSPKHPRIEGLRSVTSNTAALGGLVQPIDYSHCKCHRSVIGQLKSSDFLSPPYR